MRTCFVFDTVLYNYDNSFYARTLHYDLWKTRYLKNFDHINVVTRKMKVEKEYLENNPMLQLVDGDRVEVNPISDYKNIPDIFLRSRTIKNELKKQISNSDFVIVRMPAVLGIVAIDICKELNKPYLVELVADPWDSYFYHTSIFGKIVAPFMYLNTKKRVKHSKNVLYVTKKFLQKRYPTNGEKYIGISDVIIKSENNNPYIDAKIKKRVDNIINKKIRFGLVGKYDLKTKGQLVAIKALSKLENKNFVLELVGNGEEAYLSKYIRKYNMEKNIIFVGSKQSGTEMFKWYDSVDVLLVPSFQEGLPRVVVESMSRANLIIGSSAGGIPELIDEKYIFKKGDHKALLQIINQITICNKNELTKDMQKNYEISKIYSFEALNQLREEFYNSIL